MAYHRMKTRFENETIDHFFLKANQHSADHGKASNLLFIGTILEESLYLRLFPGTVMVKTKRSVMSVWLSYRLLLFYEENILLDVNVRK